MRTKVYPKLGERVRTVGCYSEAMMHLGLAGRPVEVEMLEKSGYYGRFHEAQLYRNGEKFSFPVLTGEAGFMEDERGHYIYPDDGPGVKNPQQVQAEMTALILNAMGG